MLEICLSFFSSYISAIVTSIPVSSTLPNSLFTAVPNVFMLGDRFMYILTRGGINSPLSFAKVFKTLKLSLKSSPAKRWSIYFYHKTASKDGMVALGFLYQEKNDA